MAQKKKSVGSGLALVALATIVVVGLGFYVGMQSPASRDGSRRRLRKSGNGAGRTSSPAASKTEEAPKMHPSVRPLSKGEGLAPVAVVAGLGGKTLYVAEAAAWQVAAVDALSGRLTYTIAIPGPVEGMALSKDGKSLYVTQPTRDGKVHELDLDGRKVLRSIAVGHTPVSLVMSTDGGRLYVCNRFSNSVSVVDLTSGREVKQIAVAREPVAIALTPDGRRAFVANHLPAGPADGSYSASMVSIIDTDAFEVTSVVLPNGSTGLRGIAVSPDGKHVYLTHTLARYQLPTTQLERGWMNTSALSVIDASSCKLINTVLLDEVDLGAANPWGVECTDDGKTICVAHAGTHEISVIDRGALHSKLEKVAGGEKVSDAAATPDDVPNDLSFLVGLRKRLKLKGNGPRGIAVVGSSVYSAEYFSDSLGIVDTNSKGYHKPVSFALGAESRMSIVRRGEMIFNDATACFQQWQSCASCHPDVRTDGLNWDLLNDGFGNPKNTKSLLMSHKTPPVMLTGVRAKAEVAVRAGIKYIQFSVRPEEEAEAIDAFLKSLNTGPSPHLVDGRLSESARRGEQVFKRSGCATCHPAPLYTDMRKHDVLTGVGMDEGREFDTPTLLEAWRTGPYLVDGRAATVKAVLEEHNKGNRHGLTSGLSAAERDDLAEYVLSQ